MLDGTFDLNCVSAGSVYWRAIVPGTYGTYYKGNSSCSGGTVMAIDTLYIRIFLTSTSFDIAAELYSNTGGAGLGQAAGVAFYSAAAPSVDCATTQSGPNVRTCAFPGGITVNTGGTFTAVPS